jgi:hypothetical protein
MNSVKTKPSLVVALCDRKAAEYAVRHWHYSKVMPTGRLALYGVWEDRKFIGCVMFGRGALNLGKFFGVPQEQASELLRVALRRHVTAVSRIISICIKLLKRDAPSLRAVVSYADSAQGHIGGIYQAGNWLYLGTIGDPRYVINGRNAHARTVFSKYKTRSIAWLQKHVDANARFAAALPKYKYAMGLDPAMQAKLKSGSKAYPKRATSIDNDASAFQAEEGGVNPTVALQTSQKPSPT